MKVLWYAIVLAISISPLSFGQSTIRTGYAGNPVTLTTATGQITSPVANAVTGTNLVTNTMFAFPQVIAGVGGTGALLLPQVVAGGGWVSQITISNTSPIAQSVRVDFFNSNRAPMVLPSGSTLSNVVVPAGGVVTLSTGM